MWLSTLTADQRETLINLAHDIVVSDGVLDPNEELMMDEFRREMALAVSSQTQYVELEGLEDKFDTPHDRSVVVLNLLRLSYVDGEFDIEEECLLKEITRLFGISDEKFRLMDNWVKRLISLEFEAQDFLYT